MESLTFRIFILGELFSFTFLERGAVVAKCESDGVEYVHPAQNRLHGTALPEWSFEMATVIEGLKPIAASAFRKTAKLFEEEPSNG